MVGQYDVIFNRHYNELREGQQIKGIKETLIVTEYQEIIWGEGGRGINSLFPNSLVDRTHDI